ncbi:phosphoribosylanthranilate isomerase [Aureisphaera galaxeae]|uniref:phosphoribosylanthranilate isomerase n=1 Tax=Aureisphaera galaxeae TaxID=1538023 RepID=UPI002350FC39|nr:phosphoribosylanthranilate isomerase [Aureisphaera galaxeae]MDC8004422.1 phosphoribosylanthranilate isomerase [Aureisphaera galaxeae]
MKHNTAAVDELRPDYLGFIFYEKSPRNFDRESISDTRTSKRVGVFVDASIEFIIEKTKQFGFDVIQLHGEESDRYCWVLKDQLASEAVELWKVFSIKDTFDFKILQSYESVVDKYLFDTKGKEKGGNGYTFDWSVLKDYPSKKPFVLSGGIGLEEMDKVRALLQTDLPIYAIDVNSRFEVKPGLKDISALKKLNHELQR